MYKSLQQRKQKARELPNLTRQPNPTGIPEPMKQHFEDMSGLSFQDVRIHYHSSKPAQRQAYAYTQGNQVYVAPGQEKYLGHELGHIIQQKQGRVKPNWYQNGEAFNDSAALEREADSLAAVAASMPDLAVPATVHYDMRKATMYNMGENAEQSGTIQRTRWRYNEATNGWDEEEAEESEVYTSAPQERETALLLEDANWGKGPLKDGSVDTASYEYLCWLAEKSWNSYGGFIGHTLHSPGTTKHLGGQSVKNKLFAMYEGGEGARYPREYGAEEDIHRFLRWFSTFLSVKYEITGEIQCYYDKSARRILISTNLNGEIRKLRGMLGRLETDYSAGVTERQKRHMGHIYRINAALEQTGHMFGEVRLQLVGDIGIENAHAEQRILHYLKNERDEIRDQMIQDGVLDEEEGSLKLRPEYLGGIRRCCFACAYACFTADNAAHVHMGPFWDSKASGIYMENEDIVRAIEGIRAKVGTHVTVQREKATMDNDTDSDTQEADEGFAGEEAEEEIEDEIDMAMVQNMGDDFYQRVMDAFFC